uniref:ML domain-containing protein n=1 Tax=Angiostrongylus cantonensis TaxID=6313 RepID=A0A0K0DJB3_ANGCA
MWSLLICSTLAALIFAAPPIVPYEAANGGCVDGVNNVVDMDNVGDPSALFIRVKDVIARTYDDSGNPSCYEGRAAVKLPGIIKLLNGKGLESSTITVTKSFDLKKSGDIKLTLTKDSFIIGTVCKNGVSESGLVPSSDCHHAMYPELGEAFMDMISTPGTYDLEEIEKTTGKSNIVKLPAAQGALAYIIKGDWKTQIALVCDSQQVADIKIPSNTDWLYIN